MGSRDAIRNLVQAVAENIDPNVDVGIVRIGIPCPKCGVNYWEKASPDGYRCKKCGFVER